MTTPPGLQAIRERAECPRLGPYASEAREVVPALVDLIEELAANVVNMAASSRHGTGCVCAAHEDARAALDKYREFE